MAAVLKDIQPTEFLFNKVFPIIIVDHRLTKTNQEFKKGEIYPIHNK